MKPKDLKFPYQWEARRPVFETQVLFIPKYFEKHGVLGCEDFVAFIDAKPTYVEFCSGNGAWIIEKARQHPDLHWIAVEKRFERVRKIWSKMANLRLDNLVIVAGEAEVLTRYYLPDNSVAGSYINFPDPWPKEKHAKNRLFQAPFLQELSRVMRTGSETLVVTDDPIWAERICHSMHATPPWESVLADPFYVTEWPGYGASYFDSLWRKEQRTIHYMHFRNCKAGVCCINMNL